MITFLRKAVTAENLKGLHTPDCVFVCECVRETEIAGAESQKTNEVQKQ